MTDDRKEVACMVNVETREIIDTFKEGDSYKKSTPEDYDRTHVMNFNNGQSFVKLYDEVLVHLRKNLTPSEFTFTISLATYVSYDDCILRKTSRGNSNPVTLQDLAKDMELDISTVRKRLAKLKKKGVIGEHETGSINPAFKINGEVEKVYTCNPYIFIRGKDINKTVVTFYNQSGWKDLIGG